MHWIPESHSRRTDAWAGVRSPRSPEPHQFQNIILQSPLSVGWSETFNILLGGAVVHIILSKVLLYLSLFCSPLADTAEWWGGVVISHCCFWLHTLWYFDMGNWGRFVSEEALAISVSDGARLITAWWSSTNWEKYFYEYSPLFCISYGLFLIVNVLGILSYCIHWLWTAHHS